MRLRVACIRTAREWENPAAHVRRFAAISATLTGAVDLIVLPEMFTTGFFMEPERVAEPARGATLAWLLEHAHPSRAAITGSVATAFDSGCANRLLWATPDGSHGHYDTRHLSRMGNEREHYTAGARALENQSLVIGGKCVDADGNGVAHAGDSAVIDYLGERPAQLADIPGVVAAELDLSASRDFRQRFPAHLDADRFTLAP